MNNRRYERGGVVSFLVVAIVLAVLLGTGIWWAKRSSTTNVSTQNGPSVSENNGVSTPQTGGDEESTGDSAPASGGTGGAQGSSSTNSSNSGSSETTGSVASTGPSTDQIPDTGPTEVIATTLAFSVGSAGMYYLLQSRRRVRGSALK